MASTNKTTNYELSQFLGTDKPAWLSDYNQDMSKIDAQMKLNADGVTSASGSATTANTNIGTLASLTTESKTNLVSAINEVDSNADTAQTTANQAVNASETNATNITALTSYLNLNNFTTPTVTISGGTIINDQTEISCASNSDGSLGKIYGRITVNSSSSSVDLSFDTPFRPSSSITINGIAFQQWSDDPNNSSSYSRCIPKSLTIGTNGVATVSTTGSASGRRHQITIIACLLFMKSFGDVIQPE